MQRTFYWCLAERSVGIYCANIFSRHSTYANELPPLDLGKDFVSLGGLSTIKILLSQRLFDFKVEQWKPIPYQPLLAAIVNKQPLHDNESSDGNQHFWNVSDNENSREKHEWMIHRDCRLSTGKSNCTE